MITRHVTAGASTDVLRATLVDIGFEPQPLARPGFSSSFRRGGVAAHVGALSLDQPWGYLVTEGEGAEVAGELAVASGDLAFVETFDAVAFFQQCAQEVSLGDDGVVYVVDVPGSELLTQLRLVGACATGSEVDPDAVEILARSARSRNAELQAVALEAIGWSTWPALGEVLDEVAASDATPEVNRRSARRIADARRASGWSVFLE